MGNQHVKESNKFSFTTPLSKLNGRSSRKRRHENDNHNFNFNTGFHEEPPHKKRKKNMNINKINKMNKANGLEDAKRRLEIDIVCCMISLVYPAMTLSSEEEILLISKLKTENEVDIIMQKMIDLQINMLSGIVEIFTVLWEADIIQDMLKSILGSWEAWFIIAAETIAIFTGIEEFIIAASGLTWAARIGRDIVAVRREAGRDDQQPQIGPNNDIDNIGPIGPLQPPFPIRPFTPQQPRRRVVRVIFTDDFKRKHMQNNDVSNNVMKTRLRMYYNMDDRRPGSVTVVKDNGNCIRLQMMEEENKFNESGQQQTNVITNQQHLSYAIEWRPGNHNNNNIIRVNDPDQSIGPVTIKFYVSETRGENQTVKVICVTGVRGT